MGPIAGAFASGNRVMVKTSEYTPRTGNLFEAVAGNYFPDEELAFFPSGPEVSKAFPELGFDHLLFTGATSIGRHILHAAVDNLTPVTLALGGKSPVIVGRSAALAKPSERVALGKMLNGGQICLAPDYMSLHKQDEGLVVEQLKAAVSVMYPQLVANPDYTAIVNDRHSSGLMTGLRMRGPTARQYRSIRRTRFFRPLMSVRCR